MIYVNIKGGDGFDAETYKMAKFQIDNAIRFGWGKETIILITNFEFSYNGISSLVIDDNVIGDFRYHKQAMTRVLPIILRLGLLPSFDMVWIHDFDAFQVSHFDVLPKTPPILLTTYGWRNFINTGSWFFNNDVPLAVLDAAKEELSNTNRNTEEIAWQSISEGVFSNYIEKLNITYNFGCRKLAHNYKKAIKPIKVIHFHPECRGSWPYLAVCTKENELGFPLVDEEFIKLMNEHNLGSCWV